MMFWVPQSGRLGLGVSIFSYNDQVWLGIATDQSLVPDPETIVAYYGQEIDELYGLTQQAAEWWSEGNLPAPASAAETTPDPAAPVEAPTALEQGEDDLTRLAGIGPTFAGRLSAAGVTTYTALAASTPDALAAIVQAPDWRRPDYASWIDQARALAH